MTIACAMCGDTGLQNNVPCPQPGCKAATYQRTSLLILGNVIEDELADDLVRENALRTYLERWDKGEGCAEHKQMRDGSCHECAMLQPPPYWREGLEP